MRPLLVVPLLLMLLPGCGHGSDPTGPTQVSANGQAVTAHLQDRFLFDHNAGFTGGRTFRWVPPIPIYMLGPEPSLNELVLQQFLAWESALGGVAGTPFYVPQAVGAGQVPSRGILFERHIIEPQPGCGSPPPGFVVVGCSNPFGVPDQPPQFPLAELPQHRQALPEVTAGGEIRSCVSQLNPRLSTLSVFAIKWFIRHEIGRCLGFLGTVSQGVMRPACCPSGSSLAITSDVAGMMRTLYRLPPGTDVTR